LQYSRKHESGAVEHVDEAQEHASAHTGKNHELVQSVVSTLPSFNRDAVEAHEKSVELDDRLAVPARAMFTSFSA
jgi:hypothetical protein